MKEIKRYEIYRDGSELETIAWLSEEEYKAYVASGRRTRQISERVEVNDAGQEFRIYGMIEIVVPRMDLRAWRNLRNHLQALACQVNVHSKEYRNLCNRIKWIYDNRLTWRAEAATQAELPF